MKIYIIKVTINDCHKTMYIDSVWKKLEDAQQYIEKCQEEDTFNENFKAEIQEEELYEHI